MSNVDQYSLDMFNPENVIENDEENMYKQRIKAGGGWTFCFGKAAEHGPGKLVTSDSDQTSIQIAFHRHCIHACMHCAVYIQAGHCLLILPRLKLSYTLVQCDNC
jgi:hypothetical protein